jgi:hypothetical protein
LFAIARLFNKPRSPDTAFCMEPPRARINDNCPHLRAAVAASMLSLSEVDDKTFHQLAPFAKEAL